MSRSIMYQSHGIMELPVRTASKTCITCNTEFSPNYDRQLYCKDACFLVTVKKPIIKKPTMCPECNSPFFLDKQKKPSQKYCNTLCTKIAYDKRQKALEKGVA